MARRIPKYERLGEDALEILEKDEEVRLAYLDLLTALQDLLSKFAPYSEPMYGHELREKIFENSLEALPSHSGIRQCALANWETGHLLTSSKDKGLVSQFLAELYGEYDSIRLQKALGGTLVHSKMG